MSQRSAATGVPAPASSHVVLREVRQGDDGILELGFLVEHDDELTSVTVPVNRRGGFTFPHGRCSSGESVGADADKAVREKAREIVTVLQAASVWAKHVRGPV